MPDVYRYAWTGQRTGNTYELDICAADPSGLGSSPVVESLNNDAIRAFKDWAWEFDKFPVGMATMPLPTITFNMDRIPSTLQTWLMDTPVQHTVTLGFGVDVAVATGCAFRLRVGGALKWYGVQDVATRLRPDVEAGTLEVTVDDALRVAMKAVTTAHMRDYTHGWFATNKATDVIDKRYYCDLAWDDAGTWYRYRHYAAPSEYLWGVKRRTLWDMWDDVFETVLETVTRRNCYVALRSGMEELFTDLRKQQYSAANTYPSATVVADADVYMTPFICDATDALTTSLYDDWSRNYPSMYDVIVDTMKQSNRPCCIEQDGLEQYIITSYARLATPATTTITGLARKPIPDLWGRVLQNATMSYEFAKGDDFDKYEHALQSGRNDETLTTPVIYNWSVSANGWDYLGDGMKTVDAPLNKFLYLDTLDFGTDLVKCHSWWSTGSAAPGTSPYTLTHTGGDGLGIVDQQSWGVMRQGANDLMAAYGTAAYTTAPSLITYTVPLDLYDITFRPYSNAAIIDVPSFKSWLTIAPDTWHAIKWNADLFTELAEVEAYGQ